MQLPEALDWLPLRMRYDHLHALGTAICASGLGYDLNEPSALWVSVSSTLYVSVAQKTER